MPGSSDQVDDFVGKLGNAIRESNNKRARDEGVNNPLNESLTTEEMEEMRDIRNQYIYKIFSNVFSRIEAAEGSLKAKDEIIMQQTTLINNLETRLGLLEKEVETNRLNNVEMTESAQISNKELSMWSTKVKGKARNEEDKELQQQQHKALSVITTEMKEQEKKRKNIVIFNMKESKKVNVAEAKKEDEEVVGMIFSTIGVDSTIQAKKVTRYSKSKADPNKVPIVVIELEDEQTRNKVLYAAKALKSSQEFKNVYLNADMTQAERSKFNELRILRDNKNREEKEKNKFRWAIRDGEVKKFKVVNQH
jgi:hypothetical protein